MGRGQIPVTHNPLVPDPLSSHKKFFVCKCDTQDRRQIDITNGWDRRERVKTMPLQFQGDTVALPALSVAAVDIAG